MAGHVHHLTMGELHAAIPKCPGDRTGPWGLTKPFSVTIHPTECFTPSHPRNLSSLEEGGGRGGSRGCDRALSQAAGARSRQEAPPHHRRCAHAAVHPPGQRTRPVWGSAEHTLLSRPQGRQGLRAQGCQGGPELHKSEAQPGRRDSTEKAHAPVQSHPKQPGAAQAARARGGTVAIR